MPNSLLTGTCDCDKCGKPVQPSNDAVLLDAIGQGINLEDSWAMTLRLNYGARHLLPVVEEGQVVCVGSPSRAQYLPGQPRDPRNAYNDDIEAPIREAYATLQELCRQNAE